MEKYQWGMVGLGVMGGNLALNMAEHGIAVLGYDKQLGAADLLHRETGGREIAFAADIPSFVTQLARPRRVMMLVPAGPPVDDVIHDVAPRLAPDDILIDGGNSFFQDTDRRAQVLAKKGIHFLGVGISGGAEGARHGPSLMPGGPEAAYRRVQPVFETVAARVDDQPCTAYLGSGSAGHYVKMVHNGIEYALMQLIAETYDLLKRGLGLNDEELQATYAQWNETELSSYLLEITHQIFSRTDERTGQPLIDVILDEARQKGTGMWASQDAMELQVPTPSIDVAVAMRHLSALKEEREAASWLLARAGSARQHVRTRFLGHLRRGLYAAMIIVFAQGMALLRRASQVYGYGVNLEEVAQIWRGGCIIRAALLNLVRAAFHAKPNLVNLVTDPRLSKEITYRQKDLRAVVRGAAEWGVPCPGFMVALSYFDAYRSAWLPANLIEAQRDYFGAHSYERVDAKGSFHTEWDEPQETMVATPEERTGNGARWAADHAEEIERAR